MYIESLQVRRVRNIESADLEPSTGVNLIVGANAAGKTSLLEAIDFLSRGRSFRVHRADELIQSGADACNVFARLVGSTMADRARLGIERRRGTTRGRIDGADSGSIAELARRLAVVALEPESVGLVAGAPAARRALVDWGAFHLESGFGGAWQRYGRLLAQRNALLKGRAERRVLAALDSSLAQEGERVSAYREGYLEKLAGAVQGLDKEILGGDALGWRFKRGWREEDSLLEALERHLGRDSERGFTSVGPHRADLELLLHEVSLATIGSRGQQKSSVAVLKLAQARLFGAERGEPPVVLLDDVASELDREHRAGVLNAVESLGAQVFITAIEEGSVSLSGSPGGKLFHVEHGRIQELV